MSNKELYQIAVDFRNAIMEAKYNRVFSGRDRMHKFPNGCCDDTCDLFAYFLHTKYQINAVQWSGTYYDDENPDNITNHNWLRVDDTIIDLTADQFEFFSDFEHGIYVGGNISFYESLERKNIFVNCDITENDRLWNDYKAIMCYMQTSR